MIISAALTTLLTTPTISIPKSADFPATSNPCSDDGPPTEAEQSIFSLFNLLIFFAVFGLHLILLHLVLLATREKIVPMGEIPARLLITAGLLSISFAHVLLPCFVLAYDVPYVLAAFLSFAAFWIAAGCVAVLGVAYYGLSWRILDAIVEDPASETIPHARRSARGRVFAEHDTSSELSSRSG